MKKARAALRHMTDGYANGVKIDEIEKHLSIKVN